MNSASGCVITMAPASFSFIAVTSAALFPSSRIGVVTRSPFVGGDQASA
jgi:hypothetical protein